MSNDKCTNLHNSFFFPGQIINNIKEILVGIFTTFQNANVKRQYHKRQMQVYKKTGENVVHIWPPFNIFFFFWGGGQKSS